MLVQVVKEERGNKGAALTTYLSLAGRYGVLMPNTARGGGISRKITTATDRKRLKGIVQSLDVPQGMGLIVRTAGAKRTKAEIKRDYDYLLRLWENIRETHPALDRAGADLRGRGPREAGDPRPLRQGHRRRVRRGRGRLQGSARLHAHADAQRRPRRCSSTASRRRCSSSTGSRTTSARSIRRSCRCGRGGYLVINQTEALVAVDVNSGRVDPRAEHRGHGAEDQHGGGRGGRPPAAPARPGRPDRHRLHRHGRVEEQPRRREEAEGLPEGRPRPRADGQDQPPSA